MSGLVGRVDEQRVLRADLSAAADGHGGLMILGGEAGIGKTSLARDLAGAATTDQFLVLVGHCYDLTVTPPYGPWLDLAAGYSQSAELPLLPQALASGRIDEIKNPVAFFAEVRAFLSALAAIQPVLLVLEDAHWADPASLELLRFLGSRLGAERILLLVTYRRDELTRKHAFYQQLPMLVRETGGRRMDLRPLDSTALATLVATLHPMDADDEGRLVSYLEQHAEGNPFFAVELLRALTEVDLLKRTDNGWRLGELRTVVMPSLVRQIIDGRVSRLGDETREPMAVAAVIGQDVSLDLWRQVLALDEETLLMIVERAIEAHLLDAAPDGTRVRFVHALTREALYESILPPRRRHWHLRVAEALMGGKSVSSDAVAFHLERCGDPRAWEWYQRAGERAQRAYSWQMAQDRFATAAGLLEGVSGKEAVQAQLLYRCGRLQRYSDPNQGIQNLSTAERLASIAGRTVLEIDARYSRGLLRTFADNFGAGLAEMTNALAELEALDPEVGQSGWSQASWMADALPTYEDENSPDIDPAASILIAAGTHHRRGAHPWFIAAGGYVTQAQVMAEDFVALTAGITAGLLVTSSTGHAHLGLGISHATLGRPAEAQLAFARAREIYRQIDHHAVIGFTLVTELLDVMLPYFTTRVDERRQMAAAAEAALAVGAGAFPSDRLVRRARMMLHALEGRWDEAREIAAEGDANGSYVLRRAVTIPITPVRYWRGRSDLVSDTVRRFLPEGPATEPGGIVFLDGLILQRVAVDLAIDREDYGDALSWLQANDLWLAWNGSVLGRADNRLSWAAYFRAIGKHSEAIDCANAAVAMASEPEQPLALLAALRLRGELKTASGNCDAAALDLQRSLKLAKACEAPLERAKSLVALAELSRAQGHIEEASVGFAEAQAIAEELRARVLLDRISAQESRTGDQHSQAPAGLTRRELEVLSLVAQGMTDADVASHLFISPRTVGQHLRSIYNKLDVSSRVAATRFAIDHNLT